MYVTSVCQCQCHQCDNDFSVSQCVSDTAYPVIWNSQPEISGTSILPAINMNITHLTLLTFDTSHLMIHKERLSVTNIWEFILAGTNEGTCSESMRPFCWLMWCQSEKGWSDLVSPKSVNKSAIENTLQNWICIILLTMASEYVTIVLPNQTKRIKL